jgi:hypothetical protein
MGARRLDDGPSLKYLDERSMAREEHQQREWRSVATVPQR